MSGLDRRAFLRTAAASATGLGFGLGIPGAGMGLGRSATAQEAGARPAPRPEGIRVLNPLDRVPLSFIIDDSTCLANLAYFAIPQFAEVFPDRYRQDWRSLPREIPDSFVREFAEWCGERGIKGKYSVVPYPACVGWVDRDLPGWSKRELMDSLKLVREELSSNWDFHPEMVSHTWAIDIKTGRPYEERSERFQENWGFSVGKSADELASYLGFALKVLKNAGIPCEGVTTPGGFGTRVLPALSQATLESCRDVFQAEIPHYFRHLFTDGRSVAPRVEYASGLDGPDPKCAVSIIGCTGDWFGGWDGLEPGSPDLFLTEDGKSGRLKDVIARGEPAILVCHWPGIYFNGQRIGFHIFKQVVHRLNAHYDHLRWMKLSEIARYWAARELTTIERAAEGQGVTLQAPFAAPDFTIELPDAPGSPTFSHEAGVVKLTEVANRRMLKAGTWVRDGKTLAVCFDLPKGRSKLTIG